jgi:hypothetical protein
MAQISTVGSSSVSGSHAGRGWPFEWRCFYSMPTITSGGCLLPMNGGRFDVSFGIVG